MEYVVFLNILRHWKGMLNSGEILKLIETDHLISEYIDIDKQLQPSGFDLSLGEVQGYAGEGRVDFSNQERIIAKTEHISHDSEGWFTLESGCYLIVYNEIVKMPLNLMAIARTRSTLLRNGVVVETAVWDPGYQGRSSSLLVVHNPRGIKLKKNARVAQLIFFPINEVERGYSGAYQRERM